jgi:hypothetical protein
VQVLEGILQKKLATAFEEGKQPLDEVKLLRAKVATFEAAEAEAIENADVSRSMLPTKHVL